MKIITTYSSEADKISADDIVIGTGGRREVHFLWHTRGDGDSTAGEAHFGWDTGVSTQALRTLLVISGSDLKDCFAITVHVPFGRHAWDREGRGRRFQRAGACPIWVGVSAHTQQICRAHACGGFLGRTLTRLLVLTASGIPTICPRELRAPSRP